MSSTARNMSSSARAIPYTASRWWPDKRTLLVPQSLHRIEPGCLQSRPGAEKQADQSSYGYSKRGGPQRNRCGKVREGDPEYERGQPPQAHPEQPAKTGQHYCLGEKLNDYIGLPGPHGLANADFPRPLRDRHQHDVHHADASHQEADRTEANHDDRHRRCDAVEVLHHLVAGGEPEIVGFVGWYLAQRSQRPLSL